MTWLVVGASLLTAVAGLSVAARRRFVIVRVDGVSMTPTLHPDDRVVVRRRPASRMRAGDVVVLREPVPCRARVRGPVPLVVKRLAAAPGDPYPDWLAAWAREGTVVPPDRYVVVGDNRDLSVDSRRFGPVSGGRLIGVVVRRVGGGPTQSSTVAAIGFGAMGMSQNLGAAEVELTGDDLREIEAAAAQVEIQGARYPEHLERMTDL